MSRAKEQVLFLHLEKQTDKKKQERHCEKRLIPTCTSRHEILSMMYASI